MLATGVRFVKAQPQGETCAVCHSALGVDNLTKPVEMYKADIHAAKGFGCVACHGGDGTKMGLEAMDKAKGYIGKPTPAQVIDVCGHCHSNAAFMRQYNPSLRVDQVTEYYTSVHGRRLREQNDNKVATCASCHKPHSIRPPSDARSSVYPSHVADTCASCHANAEYMVSTIYDLHRIRALTCTKPICPRPVVNVIPAPEHASRWGRSTFQRTPIFHFSLAFVWSIYG